MKLNPFARGQRVQTPAEAKAEAAVADLRRQSQLARQALQETAGLIGQVSKRLERAHNRGEDWAAVVAAQLAPALETAQLRSLRDSLEDMLPKIDRISQASAKR